MSKNSSSMVRNTAPEDAGRGSRALDDMERTREDGTAFSLEERLAMLREFHTGDILPDINKSKYKDPEMHYFWASTSNKSDPVFRRQQMGYVFVRAEELPELARDFRISEGTFEGCVGCNEMILMKIHRALANELMKINHHEVPLEQEQAIKAKAIDHAQQDSSGVELGRFTDDDKGFKHLVKDRPPPKTFL